MIVVPRITFGQDFILARKDEMYTYFPIFRISISMGKYEHFEIGKVN